MKKILFEKTEMGKQLGLEHLDYWRIFVDDEMYGILGYLTGEAVKPIIDALRENERNKRKKELEQKKEKTKTKYLVIWEGASGLVSVESIYDDIHEANEQVHKYKNGFDKYYISKIEVVDDD